MKSDLDLIIETLTAEKIALEEAVENAVSEFDYLIAHYHHEALIELDNKLRVLRSFKDPLHQQKAELKRRKIFLSKRDMPPGVHQEAWELMSAKWNERFKNEEQAIEELEQSANRYFTDNQLIDDALFNLYEGIYKGFNISIDERDEFVLKFENTSGQLLISTEKDIVRYEPNYIIDNRISAHLQGLGFMFDYDKGEYVYKYNFTYFKDATPIKILLSRLIFDLYKLYDINQNCTLVYYN